MSKVLVFFTSIWSALTNLWKAAYNLTVEDRKRSVRIAVGIGVALIVLMIFSAGKAAGQVVSAEHPVWEAVLQARMTLVRLVFGIPLLFLGAFAGTTVYQVVENTDMGKRLLIWDPQDDAQTRATKTRNAGSLLGTLLAASILGLLLGVLR